MYVAQKVNHVIRHVDEEQRYDGVEVTVPGEDVQEVALDEFNGFVRPVVRHCHG